MEKEKMTPQSKHIYDLLPKEMRDNTKKVSMEYRGYLRIIQSHLKTIYGMRADWKQCIKNYQKKNKELNGNFCNDISELSMNEIKNMVEKEEINLKSLEEDLIRRDECWNFLDKFDVVKHWSIGSPNYLALAQHYGFRTEMIDITNDLKTAIMLKAMICIKIINSKNINIALHQNFDGQIYDAFSLIVSLERMKQP